MRERAFQVIMIDPANYTPHYDLPLCDALVVAGVDVRLLTSRFAYETGSHTTRPYAKETFYRAAAALRARGTPRRLLCSLEHVFDWLAVLRRVRVARSAVVVHSQWLPVPSIDLRFLALARRAGAALVHTVHNLQPNVESRGRVADCRALYTLADCLITHTAWTTEGLRAEFHVPAAKIRQIHHGIIGEAQPMVPQGEARRHLGLGADDRIALFFGALRREKGLQDLIAAFPRVIDRCPSARLLVAGRPQGLSAADVKALRNAAGLPPERLVTHFGYVPTAAVPLYYGAADVAVYPYRKSDQSGALLLGLTLGRAAVVTDVGGLPEVVHNGVHGLVVPVGDLQALAQALADLLCTPERAKEMGEAGRSMALEEFGWAAIATKTMEAYRAALASRSFAVEDQESSGDRLPS